MQRIAIIGSGFGGISAALYLAQAGYEVTVFEKNEQLGGRASVLHDQGFQRDMGPSWYLLPDVFERIFSDHGERVEDHLQLQQLAPSYRVFFSGRDEPVDIYQDIEQNRELFESLEPGSMDKLKEYLDQAAYQYEIAMREFVWRRYEKVTDFFTMRMLTEGVRMKVFQNMHSYVKKYFKTPEMQKIMEYTLVFLGTAPKDAPALYNIMSHVDFGMGVFYPQGGIRAVVEALLKIGRDKYNITFQTNAEITNIITKNKQAVGVELNGEQLLFDYVVSNADLRRTETQLLDEKDQYYKQSYRDKRKIAPSGFIVYAGLDKKISSLEHHNLRFSKDREKNFDEIFKEKIPPTDPSLYVCCPSKTDANVAPDGCENIFALVPFPPDVYMNEGELQSYKQKIWELLEKSLGESLQDHIVTEHLFTPQNFLDRYHSFQGTALGLAHNLMQSALFRPRHYSRKIKNLYYAGSYTNPGIGMQMCLISGKLCADALLKQANG